MTVSKKLGVALGGQTMFGVLATLASELNTTQFITLCAYLTVVTSVYLFTQGGVDKAESLSRGENIVKRVMAEMGGGKNGTKSENVQ